jgi:cytochrome c2
MAQYGCPACHVISHVPGAVGKVGPSLDSLSQRSYLAGSLPNTPQNLVQWIEHPQHFRPGTAMPDMGVSDHDALSIAKFLNENR